MDRVEMQDPSRTENERQRWMGLLATAPEGRVPELLDAARPRPDFEWLRKPEIGSVMARGRAGGTGAPFNLGEMTVTRCALTLADGTVGHAHVMGRRKADAEAAALVDALMQTDGAALLRHAVLDALATEKRAGREARARKAAATKVDFFTVARGED
jgi:alpha-D-ribose 1-methylphosphonate 5-triphosphate synthase subunit PhnG